MLALICGACFSLVNRLCTASPNDFMYLVESAAFFPADANLAIPSTNFARLASIAPTLDNFPTSSTTLSPSSGKCVSTFSMYCPLLESLAMADTSLVTLPSIFPTPDKSVAKEDSVLAILCSFPVSNPLISTLARFLIAFIDGVILPKF